MVDVRRLGRLYLPDWYITAIHVPALIASCSVQTQTRRPTDPYKKKLPPALSESSTQWGMDWYSLAPPLIFHLRHHRGPGSYYVTACCYDNRKRWCFSETCQRLRAPSADATATISAGRPVICPSTFQSAAVNIIHVCR